jgi:hypothetical protein
MMDIGKMKEEYEKTDFATVYFNPHDKVFRVVTEAKRGLAQGAIEKPSVVTDVDFESQIGAVLLRHLDYGRTTKWSPEIALRLGTPQESRAFTKKHLNVSVRRLPSRDLIVTPLHHDKGGYTGKKSEEIVVPKDDVPEKIASALRTAFSKAT